MADATTPLGSHVDTDTLALLLETGLDEPSVRALANDLLTDDPALDRRWHADALVTSAAHVFSCGTCLAAQRQLSGAMVMSVSEPLIAGTARTASTEVANYGARRDLAVDAALQAFSTTREAQAYEAGVRAQAQRDARLAGATSTVPGGGRGRGWRSVFQGRPGGGSRGGTGIEASGGGGGALIWGRAALIALVAAAVAVTFVVLQRNGATSTDAARSAVATEAAAEVVVAEAADAAVAAAETVAAAQTLADPETPVETEAAAASPEPAVPETAAAFDDAVTAAPPGASAGDRSIAEGGANVLGQSDPPTRAVPLPKKAVSAAPDDAAPSNRNADVNTPVEGATAPVPAFGPTTTLFVPPADFETAAAATATENFGNFADEVAALDAFKTATEPKSSTLPQQIDTRCPAGKGETVIRSLSATVGKSSVILQRIEINKTLIERVLDASTCEVRFDREV